jgi:hypothetical protein
MPKPQDIFAALAGGVKYTKLDMRQAYLQCEVEESTREILEINTHKGLYKMNRLNFGVASAPSIWQQRFEQILQNIPFCHCILDDVLVTGRNDLEHLQILEQVFKRLSENGLRLNNSKCSFLQDKLEYCGHVLTKHGVQQSPEKTAATIDAPAPSNVSQLKSTLGLITFYHNHLPNVSTILHPLHQLLQKNKKWNWDDKCNTAFNKVKQLIAADSCLIHFNPDLPIVLATDASPVGIGSVLSHRTPSGDRPICFASRSLSKAEQNYSQLDREGLSIVWAVKKMSDYLFGRQFTLITDNRPIAAILAPDKATPRMVAARLQRWSSFLSSYDYKIEYRNTKDNANADFLSRLPVDQRTVSSTNRVSSIDLFYEQQLESLPVTADMVRRCTRTDVELSQVYDYVLSGWPKVTASNLKAFYSRRNELSVTQGCIVWGTRVVIPKSLREQLLKEVHTGHLGIVRMKHVARSFIWWPGIDKEIEATAKQCQDCQQASNMPANTVHQWERPAGPWQRIHADFLGPVMGQMFLVVVDAYSKWPEVVVMKQGTTSAQTINVMRNLFAVWGLPQQLHTDNSPQFISAEFQQFMKSNGIRHTTSAVYHPSSNGQAERFVAIFKQALKSMKSEIGSLDAKLARFLFTYRTTVNTSTGEIPSVLMTGRRLRTRLDLVKPTPKNYSLRPNRQEIYFETGQAVWIRDYRQNCAKWIPGIIESKCGHLMYMVQVTIDKISTTWKRHVDQIINREEREGTTQVDIETSKSAEQPTVSGTSRDWSNTISDGSLIIYC